MKISWVLFLQSISIVLLLQVCVFFFNQKSSKCEVNNNLGQIETIVEYIEQGFSGHE